MKIKSAYKKILLTAFIFSLWPRAAFAGAYITASSSRVYVGETINITVSADAAAWGIHVAPNNAAYSSCAIDVAGVTDDLSIARKTFTSSCVAQGVGEVVFTLSGDTTDDNGNTENLSGSIKISIVAKPTPPTPPTPEQPQTPVQPPTPEQPQTPVQPQPQPQPEEPQPEQPVEDIVKSGNTEISYVKINGEKAVRDEIDRSLFYSGVTNDVSRIKIIASAQDEKSTIKGTGQYDLNYGENIFKIQVIAEDGAMEEYSILVDRQAYITEISEPKPDGSLNIVVIVAAVIVLCGVIALLIIMNMKKKSETASPDYPSNETENPRDDQSY